MIANQQNYNSFSGHVSGLRFEAIIAAINWYTEAGRVQDPDSVLERIMIIDEIACRIRNARVDAEHQANKERASTKS